MTPIFATDAPHLSENVLRPGAVSFPRDRSLWEFGGSGNLQNFNDTCLFERHG